MAESVESKRGSWTSPEAKRIINYPLQLLDEIRLAVSSSFHANSKGALELGGVFFGTVTDVVNVAAWRPLTREHSSDVSFVLSDNDRVAMEQLVSSAASDPQLENLQPVGWFVPHAREGLDLTETDREVFNRFFPQPWQFTMVLRLERFGPTTATFFVRDAAGVISERQPDREFTVEPLRAPRIHGYGRRDAVPIEPVADRRVPNGKRQDDELVRVRAGKPRFLPPEKGQLAAAPAPLPVPQFGQPVKPARSSRNWLKWLWIIPVLGLLAYAAILARDHYFVSDSRPATLSLKIQDWPGAQLHVNWEKDAQPIENARRGEISFDDSGKTETVPLDKGQLRLGSFAYVRSTGNVKVKLSLFGDSASPSIEEVAEFNGAPPGVVTPGAQKEAWSKEKADLEAEIKRLRGQLATETARRQELQNLVRVLETRLQITPGK